VEPEIEEDVRLEAGGGDGDHQYEDAYKPEQRSLAAAAPDRLGHGIEPAVASCRDAQAEHRDVCRPLPELGLVRLPASIGKTMRTKTVRRTASGTPRRSSRSCAKAPGPLRCSEPGVSSPEINKNKPITNRRLGSSRIPRTMLLASVSWTSWTSW
jgi:hypothetical protein